MASPFSIPGAKSTLFLALTLTLIGIAGVSSSLNALTTSPAELAQPSASAPSEVATAAAAFFEALLAAPLRRAISVANLIASALLVVASFLLTGRARSAPWWTAQALWANAGYSVAAAAANAYLVEVHRPQLLALLDAILAVQAARGDPLPADGAAGIPLLIITVSLTLGAVFALFYLGLLRVARREDIQRFVRREV